MRGQGQDQGLDPQDQGQGHDIRVRRPDHSKYIIVIIGHIGSNKYCKYKTAHKAMSLPKLVLKYAD